MRGAWEIAAVEHFMARVSGNVELGALRRRAWNMIAVREGGRMAGREFDVTVLLI